MDRQRTIGFGALFLVIVAVAALWARIPESTPAAAAPAASSAPVLAAPPPSAAPPAPEAAADPALGGADESSSEGFDTLLDGRKAPPPPASAPQAVTFGVVVFAYQGAQFAAPGSRTKEEARQKALAAAMDAKHDFSSAVAKGDRGSTSNAGRMPRGMLEPAAEFVLFSLGKGEVASEPVDTPRGYWIVRRVD